MEAAKELQRDGQQAESLEMLAATVVSALKGARVKSEERRVGSGLVRGLLGVKAALAGWRALLRRAVRLQREHGVKGFMRRGHPLFHRGTGLRTVRDRAVSKGPGEVAHAVIGRCREQLQYWQRLAERGRRNDAQHVLRQAREAERLIEGAPHLAMEAAHQTCVA